MKIILLSSCFSWSVAYKNGTTRNETSASESIHDKTEMIEASGDALEDTDYTDSKNVTFGPVGKVMINMPPTEEDWINDLQTGFLNIFANEKKVATSIFLCTLLLAFLI